MVRFFFFIQGMYHIHIIWLICVNWLFARVLCIWSLGAHAVRGALSELTETFCIIPPEIKLCNAVCWIGYPSEENRETKKTSKTAILWGKINVRVSESAPWMWHRFWKQQVLKARPHRHYIHNAFAVQFMHNALCMVSSGSYFTHGLFCIEWMYCIIYYT